MDKDHMLSLGEFDYAFQTHRLAVASMKGKDGFYYTGAEAEYKVMDIASVIANNLCFIVPQTSANFRYLRAVSRVGGVIQIQKLTKETDCLTWVWATIPRNSVKTNLILKCEDFG